MRRFKGKILKGRLPLQINLTARCCVICLPEQLTSEVHSCLITTTGFRDSMRILRLDASYINKCIVERSKCLVAKTPQTKLYNYIIINA